MLINLAFIGAAAGLAVNHTSQFGLDYKYVSTACKCLLEKLGFSKGKHKMKEFDTAAFWEFTKENKMNSLSFAISLYCLASAGLSLDSSNSTKILGLAALAASHFFGNALKEEPKLHFFHAMQDKEGGATSFASNVSSSKATATTAERE